MSDRTTSVPHDGVTTAKRQEFYMRIHYFQIHGVIVQRNFFPLAPKTETRRREPNTLVQVNFGTFDNSRITRCSRGCSLWMHWTSKAWPSLLPFAPLFLLTLFFLSYPLLTQFLTLSFSFPRPRFSTFLISLSSSLKTFPLLLLVGVQGITPRKSYEILNAYTTCTLDYFPHIETGCEESIFINFYYFCRNIRDRTDSRISHNSVFKFMLLELLKKICLLAAGHTSTSWLRLRTGGINFLLCLCFVFWYFWITYNDNFPQVWIGSWSLSSGAIWRG